MDLNTITEVAHPKTREQLPVWTAGDAWLAGGTWLFSEPQVHLTRLIDLTDLRWPALTIGTTPDQPMLPRLSRVLQDMEDCDRRRQSLHVVAGRADDLADICTRRRLHGLEG
jgi:hypothetical protein